MTPKAVSLEVENYPSKDLMLKYGKELQTSVMFTNFNAAIYSISHRARAHEKKQKWPRSYPKDAKLDDNFKLAPIVAKALMAFKEAKPYSCTEEKFLDTVQKLYIDLSGFYGIPCPIVRHVGAWSGTSGHSHYIPHSITLTGYRSVITALHEYVHARGYGETAAVWWSTNAFKLIFPKDFENLRAAQNLPFKPRVSEINDSKI